MAIDRDLNAAIAVTRFGLGAKPGEIAAARRDPRGYLLGQIRPQGADQPRAVASAARRLDEFAAYKQTKKTQAAAGEAKDDAVKAAARMLRDEAGADFLARIQLGVATDAAFRERWALFWANHFTVSAVKITTAALVGPFEQEAIRPHVFGRFEDLLAAAASHPAMLLYLDQAESIGPSSGAGQRAARQGKARGLNENLAREIMELHTVGLDAGYRQADVTEFARALTGWSVGRPGQPDEPSGFMFRPRVHEPGSRTVMARRYAEGGQDQARAVLRDLAASPYTGRHLATNIARHFVSDDPPPALVDRLADAYRSSDGRLDAVAKALIASPESWAAPAEKFKTPYEFMISAWRAAGGAPTDLAVTAPTLTAMGQKPFSAPSPKGWPQEAGAWCAPDGIVKRMTWSEAFAAQFAAERDPAALARDALGARLSPLAERTIARAETRAEGLAVLLMSPEFQRR